MKGRYYRHESGCYFVQWYDKGTKKRHKVYYYKGEKIYSPKIAQKLLSVMQSDYENGTFNIEKYIIPRWSDTVEYINEWIRTRKDTLSPATYKDYLSSIRNHIEPFFRTHPLSLHEIQYDTLCRLLNSIDRSGKGKMNVMMCLHACLCYAWRSRRILAVPPFPERKLYHIVEPVIRWLPEDRQMAVINAIPQEHRPIFLWLKYHMRRPSEAMVLHREDYDREHGIFIVRRSLSNRIETDRTKTDVEHVIPCHSEFRRILDGISSPYPFSPYLFTCHSSRHRQKRYSRDMMEDIWKTACQIAGESITMYAGLKHSSCSQYINEKGLSVSELQMLTDHARLDSVRRYARVEVARKRELMERTVIPILSNGSRKALK